jgi:DNA-binding transcriptional LysR family regulator
MDHALEFILWPVLKPFLAKYPDISVEVCCDYSFVDIAAQGFDAGVRLGEDVAQGMIATRIGPDMRMAVVGSPAYFANRSSPQTPRDLTEHQCNNLRLPTNGGLYVWEFKKAGESLNVRVSGQVTFNGVYQLLNAALDGFGLSYIPEDLVAPHLADGRLVRVLEDWCPSFAGFHLYYPSRRQASPAFALLLDALRYKG